MSAILGLTLALPVSAQSPATGPTVRLSATARNAQPAATPVALAAKGKALVPIVLAADASPALQEVAADLGRVLEQMTGAHFEVQTGDGTQGLVVGTLAQFSAPGLAEALRVNNGYEGREAYAIRTTPGRVLIVGATDMGTSDGVYRLLHELGCRWLSPAPAWEVIPKQPELSWSLDLTDRPQLLSRVIWYKTQYDYEHERTPWGTTPTQDLETWRRRNAQRDGLGVNAGHVYGSIIRANKEAFAQHPEYWPLIDGKRVVDPKRPEYNQPDLGNPEVRSLFLAYARDYLQKRPGMMMVSMEPNDGGGYSQSPEFRKLGTVSDAVFGMANEVARMLQKEFPGKMVGLYAYREHAEPPSFALEPNVYVQITTDVQTKLSYDELVKAWTRRHANVGFYEYYAPYAWFLDQLPGANASSLAWLTKRIRAQTSGPATSISAEAAGSWALLGLGFNVATQLMWNSDLDPQTLREDYLKAAFGPAVEPMRAYYNRWDPDRKPLISKNLVGQMVQDVARARELADGRPDVQARLVDVMHYLRFLELDNRLRDMTPATPYPEREAAFVALFQHLYRTRYTYMTHWGLAAQMLWQKRAELAGVVEVTPGPKGQKPTKVVRNDKLLVKTPAPANPWRVETPYTAAEVEANFRSTAAYFQVAASLKQTFSADLERVQWPAPVPPGAAPLTVPTSVIIQGGHARVALWSEKGEALQVQVQPRANRQKVQPRPWKLFDATGQVVVSGTVAPTDSVIAQMQPAAIQRAKAAAAAAQQRKVAAREQEKAARNASREAERAAIEADRAVRAADKAAGRRPRPALKTTRPAARPVAPAEPAETAVDSSQWRVLQLAVPRAGAYLFDIEDNSGYLCLRIPGDRAASLQLVEGEPLRISGKPQLQFFYVPKNTSQIEYFFDHNAPAHRILGPDGKAYHEAAVNARNLVRVAVPAGLDGKVWAFEANGIGPLWFTNLPPYLAASPERLLVPREVARRDGLKAVEVKK